jgi:hypothetical protein
MRRPKKDRSGLVQVTDLLEGALNQLGVRGEIDKFRLGQKCRELLGERMSQALVRVALKGSKVTLEFRHSIWLNEMNFRKAEVLQSLQKELPEVGVKSLDMTLAKSMPNSSK